MTMKKLIGIVCLVAGVMLVVWGHNIAQSIGGQLQQAFTGSPGDKSMWRYIGGGALCVFGVFQIFMAKQ
jgi:drug/metabolite transporter (DMT)-like permease